jgi:hypothetical protein
MHFFLPVFLFAGMTHLAISQDLDNHRWQDRVLLLFTNDIKNPEYIRQMDSLRQQPEELYKRKLLVYSLSENRYAKGLPPGRWIEGGTQDIRTKKTQTGFRLVLIGLDGGVKMDEDTFVPLRTIWKLIDGMPMRRAELHNKGR